MVLSLKFIFHLFREKLAMPRARRQIFSGSCYEICFRANSTLPFAAYQVIKLIIKSSIARAQRDEKLTLCHDIWNGSHNHLFVVCKDAEQLTKFYMEVEKKITEYLKRLLGIKALNIWEERTTVAQVLDVPTAIKRIAYFYSNPAQDNLVDSIEKFPGLSSWREFRQAHNKLEAKSQEKVPWIRQPTVPLAKSPSLTPDEDLRLVRLIKLRNKETHKLERYYNAWMKCFEITTDEEVSEINQQIFEVIRENENEARLKRKLESKPLMGVKALCSQPILKPHTPKKKERKIYVICSDKETRIAFIHRFKEFCLKCYECYQLMLRGEIDIHWPDGAFRPGMRQNRNNWYEFA